MASLSLSGRMVRRSLTVAAIAVATTLGCDRPKAVRTVNVLYFAGLPEGQLMQEEFPEFTKRTGIKVNYQEVPYDSVRQREISSIQNRLGAFDVVFVDDIWLHEYARRGYVLPLDDRLAASGEDLSDFFPSTRKAEAELDGKTWLIPQRADVQVLFYRTDLFSDATVKAAFSSQFGRELAVPETWQEYADVSRFFTKHFERSPKRIYGSGETLKRPHFAFEFFAMRYWAWAGRDFVDGNSQPQFDSPEGIQALTFLTSLAPFVAPGSANWAHDETVGAFCQGQLAMAPQWYAFSPTLRDPKASLVGSSVGVTQVPGIRLPSGEIRRTPSIGGGSLGIPVDAKDKDAAWEFIRAMTSRDFMARAAVRGAIVTRMSAYDNPAVREKNPGVGVYRDALKIAWVRPRLNDFAEVEAIIGRAVSRAFVGETIPKNALADAARELRARAAAK